jgi:hypothetical protein
MAPESIHCMLKRFFDVEFFGSRHSLPAPLTTEIAVKL